MFAPLVLLTLWMGIYPSSFTQFFDASVHAMVEQHAAALNAHQLRECDAMNWTLALPEIVLACCAMAILVFGVLQKQDATFLCTMLAVGALLLTGALVLSGAAGGGYRGLFVVDPSPTS